MTTNDKNVGLVMAKTKKPVKRMRIRADDRAVREAETIAEFVPGNIFPVLSGYAVRATCGNSAWLGMWAHDEIVVFDTIEGAEDALSRICSNCQCHSQQWEYSNIRSSLIEGCWLAGKSALREEIKGRVGELIESV